MIVVNVKLTPLLCLVSTFFDVVWSYFFSSRYLVLYKCYKYNNIFILYFFWISILDCNALCAWEFCHWEYCAQQKRPLLKNWKAHEERISRNCFSLSGVSRLTSSCKVTFYASVGEIFLPFTWRTLDESEKERMFISQRLSKPQDNNLAADLICNGCQLCGSPLDMESGYGISHFLFAVIVSWKGCDYVYRMVCSPTLQQVHIWTNRHSTLLQEKF